MKYSFARNISLDKIASGALDTIRVSAGDSQKSNTWPWLTAKQAAAAVNLTSRSGGLFDFSAACWYFAQELTELMSEAAFEERDGTVVPIGILDTAIGGSRIEEWTTNDTIATCANASLSSSNQMLFDENVRPYVGMTVKGFAWYQGENNMHDVRAHVHCALWVKYHVSVAVMTDVLSRQCCCSCQTVLLQHLFVCFGRARLYELTTVHTFTLCSGQGQLSHTRGLWV